MAQEQGQQGQQRGFVGSAMDAIFGGAQVGNPNPSRTQPPNPADSQIPQNFGQQGTNPLVPDNQTGNQQNQQQNQNTAPKDESPLAEFADLWEPAKDKDGKPIVKQDDPIVAFDEAKFNDILGKVDFTKSVDQELMQKALGGDQQSLLQIMNQVGKSSLGMTTKLTKNLVESAVTKSMEKMRGEMGENFRSQSTTQALATENPALNHPALKPLVSSLEAQIRSKFPEASPQELTAHAKKALQSMAEAIVGKKNSNEPNSGSNKGRTANGTDDVDWLAFASGEVNDISQM